MKHKEIIAVFICAVILFSSFSFSARASESGSPLLSVFADWLMSVSAQNWPGAVEATNAALADACESSPDGHHDFTRKLGLAGTLYVDTCQYCGVTMMDFYDTAYTDYVTDVQTELGTTLIGSSGYYIPRFITFQKTFVSVTLVSTEGYNASFTATTPSANAVGIRVVCSSLTAPVAGYYSDYFVYACDGCSLSVGSGRPWNRVVKAAGDTISGISGSDMVFYAPIYTACNFSASVKVYLYVEPYTGYGPNSFTASVGGPDSRTGSLVGDYGIIGDNGTIIKSDTQYIVNETNNTYTNPATGTTSTITNWTYDYSDRSYNVTTESGDTITITYGDEQVTINEGDTIYNVYYVMQSDPSTCTHNWEVVAGGRREPTCTVAGYQMYRCSICGNEKSETLAALGHTWAVKQTVTTEYDESGNLVQEGYTLYECSVCGEQYKDTSNTGPPDDGGGGSSGSSSDGVFSGIFGIVWDFFSFMFGFFKDFVAGGIKGFISALLDGASEFFGILNPVNWFT